MANDPIARPRAPGAAAACHTRALARLTRPRADLAAACAWVKPLAEVDLRLQREPRWGCCLPDLAAADEHPAGASQTPPGARSRPTTTPSGLRPAHPHADGLAQPATNTAPARPLPASDRERRASIGLLTELARDPLSQPTPNPTRQRKRARPELPATADLIHLHDWFATLEARVARLWQTGPAADVTRTLEPLAASIAPSKALVIGPVAPLNLLEAWARPATESPSTTPGPRPAQTDSASASSQPRPQVARPLPAEPGRGRSVAMPVNSAAGPKRVEPGDPAGRRAAPLGYSPSRPGSSRPVTGQTDDQATPITGVVSGAAAHDPHAPRSPWPGLSSPTPGLLPLTVEVESAELDALAEKIKRILDEEARRHGIEV